MLKRLLIACALLLATPLTAETPAPKLLVVVDPGHGGPDLGARGPRGTREKDVALQVSRRLAQALEARDFQVLLTRTDDRFVPLPRRTELANAAHADLYLSVHANAARDAGARGPETYFLSLEASDEEAMRVAMTENEVFSQPGAAADQSDVVGAILGDLIRTDHLRVSSAVAVAIQRQLARLPGPSRGVKQAPFVVLMGVNMPAALLEVGFLTHAAEERALRSAGHQVAIARAVADAVVKLRDEGTLRGRPR